MTAEMNKDLKTKSLFKKILNLPSPHIFRNGCHHFFLLRVFVGGQQFSQIKTIHKTKHTV